jgi:hypothetical protein
MLMSPMVMDESACMMMQSREALLSTRMLAEPSTKLLFSTSTSKSKLYLQIET